jgi:hypothetical protein
VRVYTIGSQIFKAYDNINTFLTIRGPPGFKRRQLIEISWKTGSLVQFSKTNLLITLLLIHLFNIHMFNLDGKYFFVIQNNTILKTHTSHTKYIDGPWVENPLS